MKRIYLLIILLYCALIVFAQSTRYPFVEEGKIWIVQVANYGRFNSSEDCDTLRYTLSGDTLIEGKTAKKMERAAWGRFLYDNYSQEHPKKNYEGAFYEEEEKLYWCPPEEKAFFLMFDCTKEQDSYEAISDYYRFLPKGTFTWNIKVRHIGVSPYFSGRREFQMTTIPETLDYVMYYGCHWVEGIGNFGDSPHTPWMIVLTGGYTARLISCSVRGRMDYLLGLPTPPIVKEGREVLHSLDGKRLATPPQQGIYLRNGKKVVK